MRHSRVFFGITALSAALFFANTPSPQDHTASKLFNFSFINTAYAHTENHSTHLHDIMFSMNAGYKAARNSKTIDEFKLGYNQLKTATNMLANSSYGKTSRQQTTFAEGLKQLQQDFTKIDQAIAANDLKAAKTALRFVKASEEKYHKRLGVDH